MNERRKSGLGRGLGALIPSAPADGATTTESTTRGGRPVDVFFSGEGSRETPSRYDALLSRPVRAPKSTEKKASTAAKARPAAEEKPTEPTSTETATQQATEHDSGHSAAPSTTEPTTEPTSEQIGEPASSSEPVSQKAAAEIAVETQPEASSTSSAPGEAPGDLVGVPGAYFREVPIELISPNPRQPRQVFDADELQELVTSIGEVGVLQPVVLRPVGDGYELVMGERRWRACQAAGMTTVPAIVRETADTDLLRDALLENLHRSQLNPLEEAAAYDQLLKDFSCSHDELATRIGRSRPQISNTIRLLNLPAVVQRRVAAGVLSAGHARALLGLADAGAMERLAQRIVAEGLSVRAVEEIVALGGDGDKAPRRRSTRERPVDERLDAWATGLADRLDTRVKIAMGAKRGRLTVEFAGVEDLERILSLLEADRAASSSLE